MQEMWVWSLGWKDSLEKEITTHSSFLAWKIPWTEQPRRLQSMGSKRVRHNRGTKQQQFYMYIILLHIYESEKGWLLSCVWLFATPCSVHGILQARILERVAISSSRGSSWPRDWTHISWGSCIAGRCCFFFFSFNGWATGEVLPFSIPSSIPFKQKSTFLIFTNW